MKHGECAMSTSENEKQLLLTYPAQWS